MGGGGGYFSWFQARTRIFSQQGVVVSLFDEIKRTAKLHEHAFPSRHVTRVGIMRVFPRMFVS